MNAPLKILLVEDNPGDVLLIQETLADSEGAFALESVERLAPALQRLRAGGIDVLLLDLTLPDSAGLDTFTAVHAEAPEVPVVVLTGLSDESLAIATLRDGAQDYLMKGQVEGDSLRRTMRYAIERQEARRQLELSEQRLRGALEEIRGLNEDLERRVAQRTSELAAANQELEAFAYSISHDLRAPLRHINGFAQVVIEDVGAQLPGAAQQYLERIQERTRLMGGMVDDLLNLARVGRQPLNRGPTPLRDMVGAVVADLETEVAGRRIQWHIHDLPVVACDPGLMRVAFTNLMANAVKYTRPREAATIEVGAVEQDGETVFFVRDNGVGFDMRYADKLFGVFQRLHRADEFEGTGVGLATVRRIVHRHGGRIWAEGAIDRGASFWFTLGAAGVQP